MYVMDNEFITESGCKRTSIGHTMSPTLFLNLCNSRFESIRSSHTMYRWQNDRILKIAKCHVTLVHLFYHPRMGEQMLYLPPQEIWVSN